MSAFYGVWLALGECRFSMSNGLCGGAKPEARARAWVSSGPIIFEPIQILVAERRFPSHPTVEGRYATYFLKSAKYQIFYRRLIRVEKLS